VSDSNSIQSNVDLTAVIVTFNNAKEITACLESLALASKEIQTQLVIVDNASRDGTVQVIKDYLSGSSGEFAQIEIITNHENLGFTQATNQGLRLRLGGFLLLLNPDTELTSNTISSLIAHIKSHPEVAVAAPQLLFPDGTVQPSCRRFPKHRDVIFELLGLGRVSPQSRVFNRWKMGDFDHRHTREVDQPQGAFLLIRSSALEQVGHLDPRFTMFFSDVDWCKRFILKGWKIFFCADSQAVHHKGVSVYKNRARMIVLSSRDFIAYFRKYYSGNIWGPINSIIGFLLLVILLPRLLFLEIK